MIDLLLSVLISLLNAALSIFHFCKISRLVGKVNVVPVMSAAKVNNALAYLGYVSPSGFFFILLYSWCVTHVGKV